MTTRKVIPVAMISAALTACASTPEVDNTPLIRTAVITTEIQNGGVKGFMANETLERFHVMDEISRVDSEFQFTGGVLSRVGGKKSKSEILRLDRGLEWDMDNRKKTYRECPIGGCKTASFGFEGIMGDDQFESEDDQLDDACEIVITDNSLSSKPSGQTRTINGFNASEHLFTWNIEGEDSEGNTMRNEITLSSWMTPIEGSVQEALTMKVAFDENYQRAINNEIPDGVYEVLPREAAEVLTKFMTAGMSEAEKSELWEKFADLQAPSGYPVSTKFQWNSRNDTCAAPEEPEAEDDQLDTGSLSGLLKSVGSQIVKQEVKKREEAKKREIALRPVFSLVTEVKSIEIKDIRESQLTVPANYKLQNRT